MQLRPLSLSWRSVPSSMLVRNETPVNLKKDGHRVTDPRVPKQQNSCVFFVLGRGSYMTFNGEVEMDASIMDGTTMKAGGVCIVKNILHPVKLSRLIMDKVQDENASTDVVVLKHCQCFLTCNSKICSLSSVRSLPVVRRRGEGFRSGKWYESH